MHNNLVEPNLARIPADGNQRATAILLKAQNTISQQLVESPDKDDHLALGRYGMRQATDDGVQSRH